MFIYIFTMFLYLKLINTIDINCEFKQTCSECVQTLGCVWCSQPKILDLNKTTHCLNENDLPSLNDWCQSDYLFNPKSKFEVIEGEPLRSQRDGGAVQIRPQKIKLTLRKGEEYDLQFQYRQAENYPIDLYYLMDLSASMENHREKLAKLGNRLVEVMRNITTDFRIGFGSFVDKTEMPFISTVPSMLKVPCTLHKDDGRKVVCVTPYSFKNHMSLSDSFQTFSDKVGKAQVSGNIDSPEGGFDAIMQAIVCEKDIGWRRKARHLLVLSTDAGFHIAGDGKLAGVVEPNDAKCHLKDNEFTHSLILDYPSISQINYVAKQNNINLIFAIARGKRNAYELYEKLQDRIENSATGALTTDSSNVVSLVLDNYNKIAESVTITDNSDSGVEIKYKSNCSSELENGCKNVRIGEVVNFQASIRPIKCHPEPQLIRIKPEGMEESLLVELEVICDCDCDHPGHMEYEINSENCSRHGNLQCGVCKCSKSFSGKNCECDNRTMTSDDLDCKKNEEDEVCSGLGKCVCGSCQCEERPKPQKIYGKFCECDNFSCKMSNSLICSGDSQGICECGQCKCLAGWSGEACECPNSNATCIVPTKGDEICSGRGNCECGQCVCREIDGHKYSGKYCEICSSCPEQRCNEMRHCVECHLQKLKSEKKTDCNVEICPYSIVSTNKIYDNASNEYVKICKILDSLGCTMIFQYNLKENKNLTVMVQKSKICQKEENALALSLGVTGSIVIAGLLMLTIWKIFTVIHDRKEYEKFENERSKAKWQKSDNPLYRKAVSEFKNPIYSE